MAFMYYIYETPEHEVWGVVLIYSEKIKAMKALHHEGVAFMAFLFNNLSAISSHEGHPYLPRRKKIKLFGGFMEKTICKRSATVSFWDGYAKWYKCWMEHNNYHDRIIDVLTKMVRPGWKVLDIGAGNGVLSLPLCAIGCEVTALEPSIGMRNLIYEEKIKRRIDYITIDERRWEDVPTIEFKDYDIIIACNSLHCTEMVFEHALKKIFKARPKNVFVITEVAHDSKVLLSYGDYIMLFAKKYITESSFAYHSMEEVYEHWAFKKGRPVFPYEIEDIKSRLVFEDDHLWIRENAIVGMYWWRKDK